MRCKKRALSELQVSTTFYQKGIPLAHPIKLERRGAYLDDIKVLRVCMIVQRSRNTERLQHFLNTLFYIYFCIFHLCNTTTRIRIVYIFLRLT